MNKYSLLILCIFACISIPIYRYFYKSWTPYYQEKLYQKPSPLVIKAVDFFDSSLGDKKALDVGAGVGNDTAFLLSNGWHVWANDIEQEAIDIIGSREDIKSYRNNLTLITASFTQLPWKEFPKFNFIYAAYSLPFVEPNAFMEVWQEIVNNLPAGGIFAGHFLGIDHSGFNWWAKRNMTLLKKEEVLNLFSAFKIEFFEEKHQKDARGVFDHSFNIIAKKL